MQGKIPGIPSPVSGNNNFDVRIKSTSRTWTRHFEEVNLIEFEKSDSK